MSKIVPTPPPGFDDLSVDEQIDLYNRCGTGSRRPLSKFLCRNGISKFFASAWPRTRRTQTLVDLGPMSA